MHKNLLAILLLGCTLPAISQDNKEKPKWDIEKYKGRHLDEPGCKQ